MRKFYFTQNQSIFSVHRFFGGALDYSTINRSPNKDEIIKNEFKIHFNNINKRPTGETDYTLKPGMEGKVSFNGRSPQNIGGILTLGQGEKLIPSSRTVDRTEYNIIDSSGIKIGTLSIDTSALNRQYADNRKEKLSNINQAEQADRFIDTFNGTAKELFDSPKYKPDFDNIVRNWHTITDGSVLKLKGLIRKYFTENGLSLPGTFEVSTTDTDTNNPKLVVGDKNVSIYNNGGGETQEIQVQVGQEQVTKYIQNGKIMGLKRNGIYYGVIEGTSGTIDGRGGESYVKLRGTDGKIITYHYNRFGGDSFGD